MIKRSETVVFSHDADSTADFGWPTGVKHHPGNGHKVLRQDDAGAGGAVYTSAMKTPKASRDIIGKHPLIAGSALMLLVAGSAFFVQRAYRGSPPPPFNAPITITLALLAIVPLARRRLLLVMAPVFATATVVALEVLDVAGGVNFSSIASIMAVFSASAYGGHRRHLACVASIVAFNGGLMYKLMFSGSVVFLGSATLFNVTGLLWNLVTFLATWWFGSTLRMSREQTSLLSESAEQLVRGREKNARWAVLDGCVLIARGLHSVLAHHLSVKGTQVSAACQVLKQYHEKASDSLSIIETWSRQAVAEPHRLLGLLRDEKQPKKTGSRVQSV